MFHIFWNAIPPHGRAGDLGAKFVLGQGMPIMRLSIKDTGRRDKSSDRLPLVRIRLAEGLLLAKGDVIMRRPKVRQPCGAGDRQAPGLGKARSVPARTRKSGYHLSITPAPFM
ncbi:hypothetical protein SLT36_22780 [Aminobacter sp. BA135]|uniref:hypothetical protein n=1 Tax=Aminobacter sp. BA135 TaxID=537596 RepID=UPI003D7B8D98